jgi:hypothetical protein
VNLRAHFREVLMSLELVEKVIIAFLASQLIQQCCREKIDDERRGRPCFGERIGHIFPHL